MEQDLSQFLNSDLPESAGDTSTEIPAAPPAPETDSRGEQPVASTSSETGEEQPLFSTDEILKHPELGPMAKNLLADYTRKTQALAEQRKALEAVDPADVEWLRQFNEARIYNPALAQQMWQEATQQVLGGSAPQSEPEEDPWVTDTERQLAERQARTERQLQQLLLANVRADVDRRFAALEAGLKITIPQEQRNAVVQKMGQYSTDERPVSMDDLPLFWNGMFGVEHARSAARQEGERIAATKAGIGAVPSSLAPTNDVEPPRAKDLSEHLEREFGRV